MDTSDKKNRKVNPAARANVLSLITLAYMFPIFKRTYQKGLQEEDLFKPLDEHKSSILGAKLEKIWREEHRKHKKSALHRALFKLFGPYFVLLGIIKAVDEVLLVVLTPLSIGRLVSYFDGKSKFHISETEAYLAAFAVVLCLFMDAILSHPSMMGFMHITMKMRVACSSLVYRKTLKLSRTALASTTVGQLVNLLSNDVSKFDQGFLLAHYVWIGPIQTAVGTYLIYREIGVAAFFGVAFLLSFIPIQIWLGKRTSVLRLRTALRTDERVRLMNEIISGIQVIKMYCWEKSFAQLIAFARKKEMSSIKAHAYLSGLVYSFEMFVTRSCVFISILGYVLLGSYITAEKVFTVKAIYDVLRPVITILFSVSITSIAEVNVSILRIQKFLSFSERDAEAIEVPKEKAQNGVSRVSNGVLVPYQSPSRPKIVLERVFAKWLEENSDSTLKGIDLSVVSNQVVAVIGPVGSGKSSLLNVILKELPLEKGSMQIQGKVSYSSQEPWLFSGSVRQNILFGNEYDEERYKQVVEVCALLSDFELFPYGDKTLVGEKGKSLSGGQKARINLARCIYKRADIYLLDDPLSAVDANVGKHLYDRCVQGFLKDKICILITHQLQYLSSVDKIIIMKDGKIELEGNYNELQTSGLDFAKLLEHSEEADEKEKKKIESRQNSVREEEEEEDEDEGPLIENEKMKSGSIKAELYFKYLRAGGGIIMMLLLAAAFLIGQFVANAGDYYVTYWVNLEQDYTEKVINNLTEENETLDRLPIIYGYTGLTIGTIFFSVTHSLYFFLYFIFASINLHNTSFSSIMNATMRFYNNNPSGRILNRFSKDLGYIDEYIPPVLFDVIEVALTLLGAFALSFIVDLRLFIPSVFLLTLFYFMRLVYIKTSRSVKRIEGITRSPIFGHMTASMHGLSTIRAFAAQDLLIEEFDHYQDNHSSAWFLFIAANRCFGFWLDIICLVFFGCAVTVLLYFKSGIYGGDIGLIITQYTMLIGSLQWGMRQWSELENHMVSVERLLEYTNIATEPERKPISNLPVNWPEKGEIQFKDVSLRYNPDDAPVLKNLNFVIQPKEKIGIVGRTGAGKSSTITALFQLYPIEGQIIIDGVDTTKVPLDQVRTKISIIPQEPVLFSGTMRKNLDPFDEYTDEMLWNALEQVELKDVISELPSGLHSNVSEGGANFSVGQRQLVCLARALIRNNRILVMDEATANVDPHTDALIQNTIREKFADCTVLTIAHRLHTVMDSDKILVMSAGCVQEFDHPHQLLQKKEGILYNLVQNTGKATAANLENVARESYERRQKL